MIRKIIILVASSAIFSLLWFNGLEKAYAHIITFSSNVIIGMGSSNTDIKVEERDEELIFTVTTLVDGKKGSYPQRAQSLLLPAVIMLSWIPLLFYTLPKKSAFKQGAIDLGIFMLFHVFFLILLTYYYNSALAKYLFHLMMEAFYVFAVVIVIKDSFKYPDIWSTKPQAAESQIP